MKICSLKSVLLLFATILVNLSTVHAADENNYNCASPMAQQEMNYCAYQDYMAADGDLNLAYKITKTAMQKMDLYLLDGNKGAAKSLLNGQRAWLKYRDLACDTEGFIFRGGSMEPLIVSVCKERLTRLRTEDLRALGEEN